MTETYDRVFRHPTLGYGAITDYADQYPATDAGTLARQFIADVSSQALTDFALAYVEDIIEGHRRVLARKIEEAAAKASTDSAQEERKAAFCQFEQEESARQTALFEAYRDDPIQVRWIGNADVRKGFRRWMGEQFDSWLADLHKQCERIPAEDRHYILSDWHPNGQHAYFEEVRMRAIYTLIKDVEQQTRLDVTEELLNTVFALGDGVRVTWGEATVEQHLQRVALLSKNAVANIETAARHQAAVSLITQHGSTCLRETLAHVA